MKLSYYPDTDSLYIDLSETPSVESREISEGVVLDYDEAGNVVGIDIDNASQKVALKELTLRGCPKSVTVDRRITPPTAVPERSVPVSVHSAPQCPDACHADRAGDSPDAPAFSHRGSVHEALADWQSAHRGGCH
jgi:uncharacterized protein YuzE